MLFLHVLQVCTFYTIIITINSYVLFSANLEDFKNLAEQLVSDKLAEKLTEFVSESSISQGHHRDGGEQRKSAIDHEKPRKKVKANKNYEHDNEHNDIQKGKYKQTKTTALENISEHDKMQETDYDSVEATTYAETKGKRYKTVKRMSSSRDWYKQPLSFLETTQKSVERPDMTPKGFVHKKEKKYKVKRGSVERDIKGNDEWNKNAENAEIKKPYKIPKDFNLFNREEEVNNVKHGSKEKSINVNDEWNNDSENTEIKRPYKTPKNLNSFNREEKVNNVKHGSKERYINVNDKWNKDSENAKTKSPHKTPEDLNLFNRDEEVNLGSKERDINEHNERDKGKESTETERGERSNGKQIFQSFSVERKPSQLKKTTNTETETVRVNGRNINKMKRKKNREIKRKDDAIFETVIMGKKKDSYEDYATPKKDDDYLSEGLVQTTRSRPNLSPRRERTVKSTYTDEKAFTDHTRREKKITKREKTTERSKISPEREKATNKRVEIGSLLNEPEYEEVKQESVKARTENLLFDSKEIEENTNDTNHHIMQGTGIPTREYYKISTPDYYKKLPRIVEKYDFNEPIPEVDREREKVDDRFAQQSARVNQKMRQQKEKPGPLESILENIGFRFMQ